ncbi:hypothetical protein K449DRAFT_393336 [Hypoxylon sp. EC38]|nr:hypothetical protein K449DRAFT_393336 [Hypoxylon sp. EC38]
MEDTPPPPYSETDIYSRSGRAPGARTGPNDDDASIDASSSQSTTIYTPPETPRESHHSFSGGDDHHTVASAHSYFESRPTLAKRASGHNLVISLAIAEDASPDDFPYPDWANAHDTTEQDWQTFLNYLLPDHASRANSQILERKLRAEKDTQSSTTEKSVAEAQLEQIKSSSDSPSQPLRDIDAMIHEWNDGFFGPRGITIQRAQAPASQHPPTADPQSEPQTQSQEQAARSRWNPFRPFTANSRALRIGRLTIDGDHVSFGDSFEVDRNGVRWNNSSTEDPRFMFDNGVRGDIPRGPGPFGGFQEGRGRSFDEGIRRGRGRPLWTAGHNHHHYGPRDHSANSHSSSSSESDSGSDSSIGSLPDWDDLKDNQLPVTKQSISAWLAHPEQPVTREMLKAARSNIKAAKNAPLPANDPAWDVSREAMRQEVRALLARFKELKREQKKSLKAIKKERRAVKRERKERRRAEKRERRTHERDFRQAERENRRHARRGGPFHSFSPASAGSAANVIPPRLHPTPHIPNVPSAPGAPGFFGPNHFGGPGFFGGGMRGGPFGGNRPWEAHARLARRQAELARAHGLEQAELARSEAESTRAHAQSHAEAVRLEARRTAEASRAHADSVRALALSQADRARADAQRTAESARAQAAAATAAAMWTSGASSYASVYAQPEPQSTGTTPAVSSGNGNGNGNDNRNKYETADALEAQIVAKATTLLTLRDTIEREQIEAARRGQGDDKGKSKTQAQQEAEDLEREIENLGRDVERLRLEADEELARKMAEEEHHLG